jgi:hypothetical protein
MTEEECTLEEHGKWMAGRNDCPKCHKEFTQEDKDEYDRSIQSELGNARRAGFSQPKRGQYTVQKYDPSHGDKKTIGTCNVDELLRSQLLEMSIRIASIDKNMNKLLERKHI